jgi:hypothetical protein
MVAGDQGGLLDPGLGDEKATERAARAAALASGLVGLVLQPAERVVRLVDG